MKPFLYYKGLRDLSQEITGNENVYLGIRPYGFHAGNMLPFIIYPLLICEELKKRDITPRLKFHIFLNDWEQDQLDGPDPINYPFNVYPANTTFQHVYVTPDKKKNIVDIWEPVIVKGVSSITKIYPETSVKAIRNSSIKNHPLMKKYLLQTLKNPEAIADILRKHTDKVVLAKPLAYAIAVCPNCGLVKGQTTIEYGDTLKHKCSFCKVVTVGEYDSFDFWFYHKPLAIPRLEIFNIDFCITGGDHFSEGDYYIREDLIKLFQAKVKPLIVLYTPEVLGYNGQRMGKSKKNTVIIPLKQLINIVKDNPRSKYIQINEK